MRPGPTKEVSCKTVFSRDPSISEKTTQNSERLGQRSWPGIEHCPSCQPVLRGEKLVDWLGRFMIRHTTTKLWAYMKTCYNSFQNYYYYYYYYYYWFSTTMNTLKTCKMRLQKIFALKIIANPYIIIARGKQCIK